MSNNVILFTPRSEIVSAQNLIDFIEFAKKLPPLNPQMEYSSPYWKGVVNFTKIGVSSRDRTPSAVLHDSILEFSKAYIIYTQIHNRVRNLNEIKALRAVEKVMLSCGQDPNIRDINMAILDKAAEILIQEYSPDAAYHGGCHLEKLKDFLVNKKIIEHFKWDNPIKRGDDILQKVGVLADARRYEKLPDEDALMAVAEIFSIDEASLSEKDIFTSSCVAILLSAPSRGSELFYLKEDCLLITKDKDGNNAVGIKWFAGKGFGYEVAWVPSEMHNTVKEAVSRLKKLSIEAREFAKTLEKNYAFDDSNLPDAFPNVKYENGNGITIKWSEALFAMFKYQLNSVRSTDKTKLWMPYIDTLNEDLSTTKKKNKNGDKANVKSIFERHNYPSYSLKTHQIRHLLSTVAKVNGLETELLTKWSGRADQKHNRVYNHTTSEQYNNMLSKVSTMNVPTNSLINKVVVFKPSTIQEINANSSLTIHQTEFGVCIHSYITSPCSKHRNCITCSEQVCEKGDLVKLERIKKRLAIELSILEADKKAIEEGSIGADRHYNKRLETINICNELIEKLTDKNLPDGTLIKISSESDISNLDRALEINNKKRLPSIEKISNTDVTIYKPKKSNKIIKILKGE
jgi:hypothetical protein